jgi:hypothetical protein
MIAIDIQGMLGDLQVTKSELDQIRELVIKAYVEEVYDNTVALATAKLATSKFEYVGALSVRKENRFTYSLVLDGSKLAGMIENGCGPFDMKVGFARSSKVVYTSKGWYLTIPMLFRSSSTVANSGEPGQILPRAIYDLIRNAPTTIRDLGDTVVSTLAGKDIPASYQPSALAALNSTADKYIPKNSIYAGLIRKQDKASGQSSYNTFRRVSSNSDPRAWIHPGIPAYNFMDQAAAQTDNIDIAETALQKFFPQTTLNVKIHGKLALELNASYNKMLTEMTEAIGQTIKKMI